MTSKPGAIGYVRCDISGVRQKWDEMQIRSTAKRLGYDLRKTIVFNERTADPIYRLRVVVTRLGVDAVIAPSGHHFDPAWAAVPAELVAVADVITVSPEQTYARWATGYMPAGLDGA
ncbi:hypothetical protein OH799_19470 [Nocardia sp. NBC_00881]|uniref:hypothetical protein n=1 Tax=Nocardia sp. NBC_00881 TaxID=2975995 RepID=UPI00386FB01F|nr:hypothetical protein OH799_19470 [Nocardia sp. NBC_00881]